MEAETISLIEKYGESKYSAGLYDTKATNAGGPKLALKYRDLANQNKQMAEAILSEIKLKIQYSGDGIFPKLTH